MVCTLTTAQNYKSVYMKEINKSYQISDISVIINVKDKLGKATKS